MSGTSLDGLDVACCDITGSGSNTQISLTHFKTIPYQEDFKDHIRSIFSKRQIDLQTLCLLNPFIGKTHGEMVNSCLQEWNLGHADIDLLASHGQTIFHAPKKQHKLAEFDNATLQIGDGDHLAVTTGIITISDFRQKNIAFGGEGAPLAVYGDYFLFSDPSENRILLNIGGIANFTLLPKEQNPSKIFTTDTGPGNTLMDAYMRRLFRKPYDENGEAASKGEINEKLVGILKEFDFFSQPFPKTTGPEVFNYDYVEDAIQKSKLHNLTRNDIIATLTKLSASSIADAILNVTDATKTYSVYASGGGAHNPILIEALKAQLPNFAFEKIDKLGISGDAKEAVLFAILANETVAGSPTSNDPMMDISMGKISFPK